MPPERPSTGRPAHVPSAPVVSGARSLSHPHTLRRRVFGAGRIVVIGIALVVTFGAFFLTGMRVANKAREVKVPSLQGLSTADANRALAGVGLVLKIDMRRGDAKVPADHVLSQEPEAGAVLRRQRQVRVRISDGQRDPAVPSVVGMAERTAEVVLAQEKIEVAAKAEIRTRAMEAGQVLAQDPPAQGHAAKVALLINRGEDAAAYVMPDVIGTPSVRAVDILRRQRFRVTVSAEVPYPGIAAGIVIRQSPQAGFRVGDGDAVQLEVSR